LGPPPAEAGGSIFGPSGTIVTTRWTETTIDVISVRPDGTPIGLISVPRDSRWVSQEGPMSFVEPGGRLAVDLCLRPAAQCGWAIFDLNEPPALPALTQGPGVTFLPTGTLLGISNDHRRLLRLRAPYDGPFIGTRIPADVDMPSNGVFLSVAADGSGVYGLRKETLPNGKVAPWRRLVLVAWDGSTQEADPVVEPYQLDGMQRLVGAEGQSAFGWIPDDDGHLVGLAIEGPATRRIETNESGPVEPIWMAGGRDLLIYDYVGLGLRAYVNGQQRDLGPLPALVDDLDTWGGLWAVSPDVAVFHDTGFETWHIVSLVTGEYVRMPGIVAGVVP
jgi:hypothetical protein